MAHLLTHGLLTAKPALPKEFARTTRHILKHKKAAVTSKVKTAATCTAKGTTTYTAVFKNSAFSTQTKDVQDIAVTAHSWSAWTTTKAATCTADGTMSRTCSGCNKTETQTITKLGHNWNTPPYTWSSDYKPIRIAGQNRYETCISVNNKFKDILTGSTVCVAKGLDFPDALAGGVFAAQQKAPLFLADNTLKDEQKEYLKAKKADTFYVFGGTGAVTDKLVTEITTSSK